MNNKPRITFVTDPTLRHAVDMKTAQDKYTIKEAGIRLFEKYVQGKIKLPIKK